MIHLGLRPKATNWQRGLCLIWIFVCFAVGTTSKMCQNPKCKDNLCRAVECFHGDCNKAGDCVCHSPCWTGANCDKYANNQPYFTELSLPSVTFNEVVVSDHFITKVAAQDEDADRCKSNKLCSCGEILYSLSDGFDFFRIHAKSGEIYSTQMLLPRDQPYRVIVDAINPSPEGAPQLKGGKPDTAARVQLDIWVKSGLAPRDVNLRMTETSGNHVVPVASSKNAPAQQVPAPPETNNAAEDWSQPHNRHKRAVPTDPNEVSNVTFYFEKTGVTENITNLRPGDKVSFLLAIHFPTGTTDMLVELFTPDNETTVMKLCNVRISHVGSNMQSTASQNLLQFEAKMEGKNATTLDYDRAILNLGNVTNSAADVNTAANSKIYIEWDALMLYNPALNNGSTYWCSAGAEYNFESEIWVGQASFNLFNEDFTPTRTPSFNVTAPDTVEIDSTLVVKVDMYIPYAYTDLYCDAFAPLNLTDAMSVCSAVVTDTDQNYACLVKHKINHTNYLSDTKKTNYRSRLPIGSVINAGVREASNTVERERITWEFAVHVSNNDSLILQQFWLGAACEIGTTQIWAGQVQVNVTDKTTTNMTETPSMTTSVLGPTSRIVGETITYEVVINVPEGSHGTYELELLAPYNFSEPQMKICNVSITYHGINVPCLNNDPVQFSSRDNSTTMDIAILNLKRLRNTNHRSTAIDPDANKVKVKVMAQLLPHSLHTVDAEVWFSAGLKFDNNRILVGLSSITVGQNATALNSTQAPTFTMTYPMGSDNIHVGAATQVMITMTTQPLVLYTPMDIELILPWQNESAVMQVCRAEIIFAGKNLPCFDREAQNKSFTYSSKSNNNVNDKAILAMGPTYNGRVEATPENAKDDNIVILLTFTVLDHVAITDMAQFWVSMGVMYSESRMWVGQIGLYAREGQTLSYNSSQIPYYELVRDGANPTDMNIMKGSSASYKLYMQLPPQSTAHHHLTVTAQSEETYICGIRIVETGWNVPCVNTSKIGNITSLHSTNFPKTIVLDFGPLSNIGSENSTFDRTFGNGTVVVEIVVHMMPDASGTHNVDVDLVSGATTALDLTLALIPVAPVIPPTTAIPAFAFELAGLNETSGETDHIAKGQSKLFRLKITPQASSVNKLLVKFFTPVNVTGAMEICSANVIFAGKNVPCIRREAYLPTTETRPGSVHTDIATVDLGFVCHFAFSNSSEENLIVIETVAKVTKNTTLNDGDTVLYAATAKVNDDQIYVAQMQLVVRDLFNNSVGLSAEAAVEFNTSGVVTVSPAQIYAFPIIVTVPSNASMTASVIINLPLNGSAVMTFKSLKVLSAGENLGCLANRAEEEYIAGSNSTQSTTQHDFAIIDLGVITNSGVTHRMGRYTADDDKFALMLEVQFADAVVSEHDVTHAISATAKLGGHDYTAQQVVKVERNNNELPSLLLTANFNSSIEYDDTLYFTDIVAFTFSLKVSSTKGPKGGPDANATTPFEAASNMIWRLNHANDSGTYFVTRVDNLSFKITSSAPSSTCSSYDIGLADATKLPDCHVTGSSAENPALDQHQIRSGGLGFKMADRMGTKYSRFVQVDMINVTKVTSIEFHHTGGEYIKEAQLYYGFDSHHLEPGEVITFTTPYATNPITKNVMAPTDARFIRVVVTKTSAANDLTGEVGLKLNIKGCYVGVSRYPEDGCNAYKRRPWNALSKVPDFYKREMLVQSSTAYYCDVKTPNNLEKRCFKSSDGNNWSVLDEEVISMVGFSPVDNALYAVSQNQWAYLSSKDGGETWQSVAKAKVDAAKLHAGFLTAKDLQWTNGVSETNGNWEANYSGVEYSNVKVLDWTTCCQ